MSTTVFATPQGPRHVAKLWASLILEQEIIDDRKMPKSLLQASLRPILASLGSYNKLNLPMLRGLSHLLELLASWFNITLGAVADPGVRHEFRTLDYPQQLLSDGRPCHACLAYDTH